MSLPIALLAIAGSLIGIVFDERIYKEETANWAAQAVGQDIANLVAYPTLLVLAYRAAGGSLRAFIGWIGVLVYSSYTYAIYVFDIHFGPLFLLWIAVFGLSIYALIGGFASIDPARVKTQLRQHAPARITGGLLLGIGSAFYLLWMSEIVPSLVDGTRTEALVDAGVPTNPVHVLDLAIFLPASIISGVLLLRRHSWGYVLAPAILVAMVLISTGIVSLSVVVAARGLEGTPAVGVGIAVLALTELVVVTRFLGFLRKDVSSEGGRAPIAHRMGPPRRGRAPGSSVRQGK